MKQQNLFGEYEKVRNRRLKMKEKDISFEDKLWKAADKLRKKVEAHEYKYVVLGLIFLRYLLLLLKKRKKKYWKKMQKIILKN